MRTTSSFPRFSSSFPRSVWERGAISLLAVFVVWLGLASAGAAQLLQSQAPEVPQNEGAAIVDSATNVLNEIMAIPAQGIPRALLRDAQGIAVVPGLIKGGFVVGVRHGRGVVVVRDENGNWRAPSFITITGGSIGWQAGVQATDVVLVFKTPKSVQGLLTGKFTIGGDVSAAAGPVGREASAATDATLRAEIYSYSRSRGLFAGAAIDGSMISLDNDLTYAYYRGTGILPGDGAPPPGQPARLPTSAERFMQTVFAYSQPEGAALPTAAAAPGSTSPAVIPTPAIVAPGSPTAVAQPADLQAVRTQLADSSRQLESLVDADWQRYLALPKVIYSGSELPSAEAVNSSLARLEKVAADPRYSALTQRAEFQQTLGLLKSFRELQAASATTKSTIALPPPPM